MEGNLLHPLVEVLCVVGSEEEFRLVFRDNSENVLTLSVIDGWLAFCFV